MASKEENSREEKRPTHKNNGAFEIGDNGKRLKSSKTKDFKGDPFEGKTKSYRYQLEVSQLNEEFDAFVNQRDPKNKAVEYFKKKFCRYCNKELKAGNESLFCNKSCLRGFSQKGTKRD